MSSVYYSQYRQPGPKIKGGYYESTLQQMSQAEKHQQLTEKEKDNWSGNWSYASGWEAVVGHYLLLERRLGLLKEVLYEPIKFDFTEHPDYYKAAQQGRQSSFYNPDFTIVDVDNNLKYIEVKGRLIYPGITKLKNFRTYNLDESKDLIFVVQQNSETHKKLRKWTWVNSDMFWFYRNIERHLKNVGVQVYR